MNFKSSKIKQMIMLIISFILVINGFVSYINRSYRYYSSPQSAYQEIYKESPLLIVEGKKTSYIFGNEENNYALKTEKGWIIPKQQNSKYYSLGDQISYAAGVFDLGNTGEHYVVVLDYRNIIKTVADSLNSNFSFCVIETGFKDEIKYNTFVAYIDEFDENYIIYINDKEITLEE